MHKVKGHLQKRCGPEYGFYFCHTNNLSGFVIKTTEGLNITQIVKLIDCQPEKYQYLYLIISVITDSFVPCNDAMVTQCFVRF